MGLLHLEMVSEFLVLREPGHNSPDIGRTGPRQQHHRHHLRSDQRFQDTPHKGARPYKPTERTTNLSHPARHFTTLRLERASPTPSADSTQRAAPPTRRTASYARTQRNISQSVDRSLRPDTEAGANAGKATKLGECNSLASACSEERAQAEKDTKNLPPSTAHTLFELRQLTT
jgi:hypothetical protein